MSKKFHNVLFTISKKKDSEFLRPQIISKFSLVLFFILGCISQEMISVAMAKHKIFFLLPHEKEYQDGNSKWSNQEMVQRSSRQNWFFTRYGTAKEGRQDPSHPGYSCNILVDSSKNALLFIKCISVANVSEFSKTCSSINWFKLVIIFISACLNENNSDSELSSFHTQLQQRKETTRCLVHWHD